MRKIAAGWLTFILTITFAVQIAPAFATEVKTATFELLIGSGKNPNTANYDIFEYTDRYLPNLPVTYYVNPSGSMLPAPNIVVVVKASFETWDNAVDATEKKIELFNDNVQLTTLQGNKYDGKNVVSWGKLGNGILAVCYTWYYPTTGAIVEFGIVFNTRYSWGIDPDGEGGITITTYDIQNIGTHEAGHTLCLGDLYSSVAQELTMYGYGARGENKKRSLGYGDIHGVRYVYGTWS